MADLQAAALIVIDVQKAIDDPRWALHGPRNNPEAERHIARLLESWRARNWPIYHDRANGGESRLRNLPSGRRVLHVRALGLARSITHG